MQSHMTYFLKRKGLYRTKTGEFVSAAELDKAEGHSLYLAASQLSMKLGGDFEVCHCLDIMMDYLKSGSDTVAILKEGLEEKRQKIYEQANEIAALSAANKALLGRLKIEYVEKEKS